MVKHELNQHFLLLSVGHVICLSAALFIWTCDTVYHLLGVMLSFAVLFLSFSLFLSPLYFLHLPALIAPSCSSLFLVSFFFVLFQPSCFSFGGSLGEWGRYLEHMYTILSIITAPTLLSLSFIFLYLSQVCLIY